MADSYRYTAYCKLPGDPRGFYSEEIDIISTDRSLTRIKREAEKIIEEMYDTDLYVSKVRRTGFVLIQSIT